MREGTAQPIPSAALCSLQASTNRRLQKTALRLSRADRRDANPAPTNTNAEQGEIEKSNVNGVAVMSRLIEITRSYTDIANILQQEGDLRKNALSQLSQTPTTS